MIKVKKKNWRTYKKEKEEEGEGGNEERESEYLL